MKLLPINWLHRFWAAILTGAALCSLAGAPVSAAEPGKTPSLDEQLLDDLATDLLPGPAPKPPVKKADRSALDDQLLDQLGDGEDVEFGKPQDPLTRIGERMRKVEGLIERRDTSARTQDMQQQIVSELEQLLQQTRQQCQGQCQSKPGSSKPSSGQPAGQQPSESEQANRPPKESTDRLGKPGETTAEDAAALEQLVKEVWGHLPEKVRGQMQNVTVEQFLPKYEKLIEEYYKRLAEEQSR